MKKALSMLLCLVMLLSLLPTAGFAEEGTAEPEEIVAEGTQELVSDEAMDAYDVIASATTTGGSNRYYGLVAAAWAKDPDNVNGNDGLCAYFVRKALEYGGLTFPGIGDNLADTLYNYILSKGYGYALDATDANMSKIKPGDVVAIKDQNYWQHVIIVTEVGSDYIRYSARNVARCNVKMTFSALKNYHKNWTNGTKTSIISMYSSSGYCGAQGSNLTWQISGNTLTISGSGDMANYAEKETPWYEERDRIKSLQVSDGVTSIGNYAFCYLTSLNSVSLADSITSIGEFAFASTSLTSFVFPNNLHHVAKGVLSFTPVTSVTIPISLTIIADDAFGGAIQLANVCYQGTEAMRNSLTGNGWSKVGNSYFFNATWQYLNNINYTVAYNANGGSGAPGSQTKTYNVALTLSNTRPSRSNASAGSYTVTLNANGGSVSPASLTAARTTSYSFKNWNTAQNGSGTSYAPGASYTANSAVTLYAQWNSSTTTAAVTLPTPVREGYSFIGWSTSSSATSGMTGSYTPDGNVTLYATWEAESSTNPTSGSCGAQGDNVIWAISGDALFISGSGAMADYAATDEEPWVESREEIKSLYIFDGVTRIGNHAFTGFTNLTYAGIPDSVTSIGNSAFALTGLTSLSFPKNLQSVGSVVIGFSSISSITVPQSLTSIVDNAFSGAFKLTNVRYNGTEAMRNSLTGNGWSTTGNDYFFNATWEYQKFTVSFNANGGTGNIEKQNFSDGSPVTIPLQYPSMEGVAFLGWSTDSHTRTPTYLPGETYYFDKSCILYAVWDAWQVTYMYTNYNTVIYLPFGDASPIYDVYTRRVFVTDNFFTVSACEGSKNYRGAMNTYSPEAQYAFLYFSDGTSDTQYIPGQVYALDKNLTLQPVFESEDDVSFIVLHLQYFTYDQKLYAPQDVSSQANNKFFRKILVTRYSGMTVEELGWLYDETNFPCDIDGRNSRDVTSYQINVAYNRKITGWTINGEPMTADTVIDESLNGATLDMVFSEPNSYRLSYDPNGGAGAPDSQYAKSNVELSVSLTEPSRQGCEFLGWAGTPDAAEPIWQPGDSLVLTQDVTLYAIWRANTYTVAYDANGGTGAPDAQKVQQGNALQLTEDEPTRTGFLFLGWAESGEAMDAQYRPGDTLTPTGDLTLYAVWLDLSAPDGVLPGSLKRLEDEVLAGCAFRYVKLPEGASAIGSSVFDGSARLRAVYIPPNVTNIAADAFDGAPEGLTIVGQEGSYAEFFAGKYGFAFVEG